MLQIGVQGPLQVEVDGALADVGGPRQRAVLRLLVGQGSSVSVDRLLTDLYEGAPPPSVRTPSRPTCRPRSSWRRPTPRGRSPTLTPRWHGGGGEAYAEIAFEPWVVPEAVRLTEQRSRAQERRAELGLTAQGGAPVVAELEALVREHPVREESWRLLALALYDAGRQGDALAALRRSREVLTDELGLNADCG